MPTATEMNANEIANTWKPAERALQLLLVAELLKVAGTLTGGRLTHLG